jgi:hypothetical protein
MTEEKRKQYEEIETRLLGTRYDFWSLLFRHPRKAIIKLLNKCRKEQKDDWNERPKHKEDDRLYCTEHIALVRGFDNSQPTPRDLLFEVQDKKYDWIKF